MTRFYYGTGSPNIAVTTAQTVFNQIGLGAAGIWGTNETNNQTSVRIAGTLSLMSTIVLNNTITASSTFNLRVGGVTVNQTTSYAASTVGFVVDTTNTDTISAGNLCGVMLVSGGTGTSINVFGDTFNYTPNSTYVRYGGGGSVGTASASTTFFQPINGAGKNTNITEGSCTTTMRCTGTAKNLYTIVTVNSRVNNTVFNSRVAGVNGNQTFTVAGAALGGNEDTTNSDTISSGNTLNSACTTGTGTQSFNTQCTSQAFVPDNTFPMVSRNAAGDAITTASPAASTCIAGGNSFGQGLGNSVNATRRTTNETYIAKNMFAVVNTNAATTGTLTYVLKRVTTSCNCNLSIGTGTTGLVEDTTDTDLTQASNGLVYAENNGTDGTINFYAVGAFYQFSTAGMLPKHQNYQTGNCSDVNEMVH